MASPRDTQNGGDLQPGKEWRGVWEGECGSISGRPDLSLSSFFLKSLKFKKQLLLPSLQPAACHVGWLEESPSLLFPLCRRAWLPGSSFSFTLVSPVSLSGPGGKEERSGWGEWGGQAVSGAASTPLPSGPLTSFPDLPLFWAFLESRSISLYMPLGRASNLLALGSFFCAPCPS